jgi:hypothetical protein
MRRKSIARQLAFTALLGLLLAGCGKFADAADAKFGDQHFKTAISLIELYRVRHGEYPPSLDKLDFIGDWDLGALSAVRYDRLSEGYSLDLVRGWIGKPDVSYPPEFWNGLGLRQTNVRRSSAKGA